MIRQLFVLVIVSVAIGMTANASSEKVLYTIDFSGQPDGPALNWLERSGFELQLGAKKLNPHFRNNRLKLQSKGEDAGLFVKALNLPNAKRIRIFWGVDRYPQGADWEKGVNAVSLAVMVSFGNKKIKSGAFYIPDAPYFIGLFLGEKEHEGKAYTGKFFTKGGRYFCEPCGVSPGTMVITEFDLEKHFKSQFSEDRVPPLSRFGFQVNTKETRGGSAAFLHKVEILGS
jgi:hypothetical protein